MTKEEKRESVTRRCLAILRIATQSVDKEGESICSAYNWAYMKLSGMETGFWALQEYELEALARYYASIADSKIMKHLLHK